MRLLSVQATSSDGRDSLPEFLTGCRYQAADGKTPSFTAAYEVTTSDFFNDPRYSGLRANRSKREAELVSNLATLDRRSYNLIGVTGPEQLEKAAQYILTVDIDTKMSDSELDNWFVLSSRCVFWLMQEQVRRRTLGQAQ